MIMTEIGEIDDPVERFFAFATEREKTRIRRELLVEARPWTDDEILRKYRFCNVFREDDKTTRWFRANVRRPMNDQPEVLLATMLFRWFNRISTGQAIFSQTGLYETGVATAWEEYLRILTERGEAKTSVLRHAITAFCGENGPHVTGAYIINTHSFSGMSKLDGVLKQFELFSTSNWANVARAMRDDTWTLREATETLTGYAGMGPFMAYEVATDLNHTALLAGATDKMTWANIGPGARRGLNVISGREANAKVPQGDLVSEARCLLATSETAWPSSILGVDQPRWSMREVEHTLCEFFKYEKTWHGRGRPREIFR